MIDLIQIFQFVIEYKYYTVYALNRRYC